MKRLIAAFLCICTLLGSSQITLAADGDTNVDGGGGSTGSGTGENFWRAGDDGVRVTIVRESDRRAMTTPVDFSNRDGSTIQMHFNFKNKLTYTAGTALAPATALYHNLTPESPIPQVVSPGGAINIAAVKRYFSLEGTIRDICTKTGFDFDQIESGDYVILLEPLVYITYNGIKFCMTATEAALYDRIVSGDLYKQLGNITHQNLPLAMFLEKPDLGFPVWSGPTSGFRTNEEIIKQLGLGTVRFRPGACCDHADNCPCSPDPDDPGDCECPEIHPDEPCGPDTPDCPCIPKDDEDDGGGGSGTKYYDYRTDTDVITCIEVEDTKGGDSGTSPDSNAKITFHIGKNTYNVPWVCPPNDSTFVWVKWHTPKAAQTIRIAVTSNTGDVLSSTVVARVSELEEITPPDPDSRDMHPGFKVPKVPDTDDVKRLEWGEWIPTWNAQWKKVSAGHKDSCSENCTKSHYKWKGRWEYKWKSYYATAKAETTVVPDEHVPTAKKTPYDGYVMKSHYGINVKVEADVYTTGKNGDVTVAQNAVALFPEFEYGTYDRVLELTERETFELRQNPFSQFKARSHFTPIWYPDGAKYTPQTVVFDMWTPGGQLYIYGNDSVGIQGSVFDDWHVAMQ